MSPNRRNILMIAHYYPPINSSGAKRFQYLSKYFVEFGANVSVFTTQKTTEDGEFTEAIPNGVNLYEFDSFGRLAPSLDNGRAFVPLYSDKPSIKRKVKDLVMDMFGQLPDPRLPFSFSFRFRKLEHDISNVVKAADVIIATSPPWSMLLAGVFLKKLFTKKLILDYGDHFSYCHEMPGNALAKKIELCVDKWLVRKADLVVTISEPMKRYYSGFCQDVRVVSNGYDYEAMERARDFSVCKSQSDKIIIRYMGIVSDGRIPRNFISALDKLRITDIHSFEKIQIEFYGNASLLKKYLLESYPNLLGNFQFNDFISYHDSLKLMIESDYLLFSETSNITDLSAQGILTTKLFEYLGSGRPVLADISKDTLPGQLITRCGDVNLISTLAEDFFHKISSPLFYARIPTEVTAEAKKYTRKNQAELYLNILEEVLSHGRT